MPFTSHPRRLLSLSVVAAGTLALLTGCGDARPTPESQAEALASALQTGDFSEVAVRTDAGAQELDDAVATLHAPFGDLAPEVTVGEIAVEDPPEDSPRPPSAAVDLEHSWNLEDLGLDEETWSYETRAEFTYDAEAEQWRLEPDSEIVLPGYSGHEGIGISTVPAERGRIMDDAGRAMVYNRDVVRIGIDKSQLATGEEAPEEDTQRDAAEQLAEVLGIDAETYADRVVAHGDQAFVEAIVHRRDSDEVTASDLADIPGVHIADDQLPLAESADFAPMLLGRVGPVTAEHLEEDPTLSAGDTIGTSGLQAAYEESLRGSPGLRIHMDGETLFSTEPVAGEDLDTGLNPRLQNLAQDVVDGVEDSIASLVAIRPSDGGILAAADHHPEDAWVSTATQSTYAPGSSFKVVSSLAMLRDGLTPDSTVECPGSAQVHGQVFRNYEGFPAEHTGSVEFDEAVATSCNTLFVNAWDDVSSAELQEAAFDLGLDDESQGIGLASRFGSIPDDSELNLHAANLFGQGVVEASALGMATVAASVAAGETVHPYLAGPAAESEESAEESGLTEDEAEDLRTLMHDTIEYGTLSGLVDVPGEHIYAKTGTAQAGDGDDVYAHTWVIAFQGDLAVAIFVDEGEFGSSTNGPLLEEFLTGARDILD
ncbi:penicillin-binding transpeptidase domain-containing protein [Nesterenkonia sp. HG001]|uniref:penicillin-binding transpeptidase domain-containing protein n=1 Tax=Nesterenkonia sp. HG001 TaxID=2983207 RepID=UPI002AC612BC|nr:penicillin-binding transpeptidase domain-containing protein [Nesterenkonia sp. HG001]MDZ5077582.1 penicillin-binding transpeptidase domain-containing protein [Nesterenkonia sp. HG001]